MPGKECLLFCDMNNSDYEKVRAGSEVNKSEDMYIRKHYIINDNLHGYSLIYF